MTDWSKVGRSSRRKGAAFERRCRTVMSTLTGHPNWRRTSAGHEQFYGDLIAVKENGEPDTKSWWYGHYVECKYRTSFPSVREVRDIEKEVIEKSRGKKWLILIGQPRSPIMVLMGCGDLVEFDEGCNERLLLGPIYLYG